MTAPNGCQGDCCIAFWFTTSHQEMKESTPKTADEKMLKDMLVPLSRDEIIARRRRFGLDTKGIKAAADDDHWYKCRHWDEDTRLCTVYEKRPKMCRDFPYARKCEYGCGHRPAPSIIQQYIDAEIERKARPK